MTTAPGSWRSKAAALVVFASIVCSAVAAPAHRRDEYLQAARIAMNADRVEIELDLTPGIMVAPGIISEIDNDKDGSFSNAEADQYVERVRQDLHVELDRLNLILRVRSHQMPSQEAMLRGEGTIRLQLMVAFSRLASGPHNVLYQNLHHSDIGVYMANALAPETDRVQVLAQRRDVGQRELTIEYLLREDLMAQLPWWTFTLLIALAGVAGVLWRAMSR